MFEEAYIPGIALMAFHFVQITLVVVLLKVRGLKIPPVYIFLLVLIYFHLITRVVHLGLDMSLPPPPRPTLPLDLATILVNRLCVVAGLVSMTLLLFFWLEAVHSQYNVSERFFKWLRIIVFGITILFALVVLILSIVWIVLVKNDNNSLIARSVRDGVIYLLIGFNLVIGLGFFVYGVWLAFLLRKNRPDHYREILKVIGIALACGIAFSTTAIVFLLGKLNIRIPDSYFIWIINISPSSVLCFVVFLLLLEFLVNESREVEKTKKEPLLQLSRRSTQGVPRPYEV